MTEITEDRKASPREQSLADFITAYNQADKCLRKAIAAELAERLPALEHDQAAKAAVLEKAYAAVQDPERDLAALDEEIARNEAERVRWQAIVDIGDVAARVEARRWVQEYETELGALRERKDFAAAQLLPLRDALTKARQELETAKRTLAGAELNATPPLAYFGAGQKTSAYAMRFGLALEPALSDPAHPEHDAAVDHMLYLATVSGFRTEAYADRLPNGALAAKRAWDEIYRNANPPQPPPSGREIVQALHTEMTNMAMNKSLGPSRIDDYRRPPAPRQVPDRPEMRVQTLRDLGIR